MGGARGWPLFTPICSGHKKGQPRERAVILTPHLLHCSSVRTPPSPLATPPLLNLAAMAEWDTSKAEGEMLEVARAWLILSPTR